MHGVRVISVLQSQGLQVAEGEQELRRLVLKMQEELPEPKSGRQPFMAV